MRQSVLFWQPARVPELALSHRIGVQADACGAAGARKERRNAGRRHAGHWTRFFRNLRRLRDGLRPALRNVVIFDYSLAGFVSAGLLFYLIYALLRPERF